MEIQIQAAHADEVIGSKNPAIGALTYSAAGMARLVEMAVLRIFRILLFPVYLFDRELSDKISGFLLVHAGRASKAAARAFEKASALYGQSWHDETVSETTHPLPQGRSLLAKQGALLSLLVASCWMSGNAFGSRVLVAAGAVATLALLSIKGKPEDGEAKPLLPMEKLFLTALGAGAAYSIWNFPDWHFGKRALCSGVACFGVTFPLFKSYQLEVRKDGSYHLAGRVLV